MSKQKELKEEESNTKMSEIELNVLIKFIGTFDGSREKLTPFLNNCRNAINLASSHQSDILLKYILSRLEGKAETACAIKEFTKWSQLEEFLKTQFGDVKHYAYLLSDLQDCKQGRNETVSQYSLRVESCLAKLLTEINISIPTRKKDELAGRVAAMQDLALNVFMIGLQSPLSTVVRCRDPSNLNEAISLATAEEKILGIISRKNSGAYTNNFHPNRPEPQKPNNNFVTHTRPQIPYNHARPTNSNAPICRYCKNIGHTIENCRKRQYNNGRKGNYSQGLQTTRYQPSNFQQRNQPVLAIDSTDVVEIEGNACDNLNELAFPPSIVRES